MLCENENAVWIMFTGCSFFSKGSTAFLCQKELVLDVMIKKKKVHGFMLCEALLGSGSCSQIQHGTTAGRARMTRENNME